MPAVELPLGAEIEEAMVVAYGPKDIYDFHALETLQCMMERRRRRIGCEEYSRFGRRGRLETPCRKDLVRNYLKPVCPAVRR